MKPGGRQNRPREPRETLLQRIMHQPRNAGEHMAAWQPVDIAAAPMGDHHPVPPMPMVMPLSIVYVTDNDEMVVEEAAPLVTNRGVVPATSPGRWDQIVARGRG